MIEATEAIVLRWYPVTNTSRMVVWYTRDNGRVTTLIKGSQRPKSPFLGQFDLFYTCELLFYSREKNEVHHCREVSPMKVRSRLRTDWRACASASFFSDMIWRTCPPRAQHPEIFDLLDLVLDELHDHGTRSALLFWFELTLLQNLGQAPQLTYCIDCGLELLPGDHVIHFSLDRGAVICGACNITGHSKAAEITPAVRALLSRLQSAKHPEEIRNLHITRAQIKEAGKLMGRFMEYHMDTNFDSQRYALGIMLKKTPVPHPQS